MNERQIRALNNLYAATVEVMNAFAPEMVTAEMRRETVARMLDNFLSGMNDTRRDTSEDTRKNNQHGESEDPMRPASEPGNDPDEKQPIKDPNPPFEPSVEHIHDGEVRYAIGPVGGVFKRLKDADAKAELLQSDPETVFFYKFYISGERGAFEIAPLEDKQFKELVARSSELLEGVTEVIAESEKAENASRVITVQQGEVVKNGRAWEITQPARIKYIS